MTEEEKQAWVDNFNAKVGIWADSMCVELDQLDAIYKAYRERCNAGLNEFMPKDEDPNTGELLKLLPQVKPALMAALTKLYDKSKALGLDAAELTRMRALINIVMDV